MRVRTFHSPVAAFDCDVSGCDRGAPWLLLLYRWWRLCGVHRRATVAGLLEGPGRRSETVYFGGGVRLPDWRLAAPVVCAGCETAPGFCAIHDGAVSL